MNGLGTYSIPVTFGITLLSSLPAPRFLWSTHPSAAVHWDKGLSVGSQRSGLLSLPGPAIPASDLR